MCAWERESESERQRQREQQKARGMMWIRWSWFSWIVCNFLPHPHPLLVNCACSFRYVVSPRALQEQRPHLGLVAGHHEHGRGRRGRVSVPHQHFPFGQLWQGDVHHRVEWVPPLCFCWATMENSTSWVTVMETLSINVDANYGTMDQEM